MDTYQIPSIDDILDEIGQTKIITTLDLVKGYWQLPVAKEDCDKTTSVSPVWVISVSHNAVWTVWNSGDQSLKANAFIPGVDQVLSMLYSTLCPCHETTDRSNSKVTSR